MANSKHKLSVIIVLSTIFGMASGLVGAIVTRVYILEDEFNFPLYGEISLNQNDLSQNLVIRNPKTVIVEHNTKIFEATKSVENSILKIYKKKDNDKTIKEVEILKDAIEFNLDNFYQPEEVLGQSFVITSDGWLLSAYVPKELNVKLSKEKLVEKTIEISNDYVIISNDKKVYAVKDIIIDPRSGFAFWQIDATDLPVKKFVSGDDIRKGQSVLAVNLDEDIWQSSILSFETGIDSLVKSSDNYKKQIVLNNKLDESFYSAYLIDLNGDLVGVITDKGTVSSIENFISLIDRLLNKKSIERIDIGINYINLSTLISANSESLHETGAMIYKDKKGVAIEKYGIADEAGLLEGDIILAVNGIIIDEKKDFSEVLSNYFEDDELKIVFVRDKQEMEKIVKLTKLK